MTNILRHFQNVRLVDFEYHAVPGEHPVPICLVAKELWSGKIQRLCQPELLELHQPPYPVNSTSLFVSFYAPAELGCHLAMGWPLPTEVLDLYVEFRNLTNGLSTPCGATLLGALTHFGVDGIDGAEKESMRQLAMRDGPWSESERRELLEYCQGDVLALEQLLTKMLPFLDLPRALLRGRYMKAAALMEHRGVPVDVKTLYLLNQNWSSIGSTLIDEVNSQFGVYEEQTFKRRRFEQWLAKKGISWPRNPTGTLKLDDETFGEMAGRYPELEPLRQLRKTLSQTRSIDLAVGNDGRNRVMLSCFRTKTGRNAPSTSRFIFGLAAWLRALVRPGRGYGLACVDWAQQELAIAAALSGDEVMIAAYQSGDPYLAFAKQVGAVPEDATKETHWLEREHFKACALGVLYGMGVRSLARRIGKSEIEAKELLQFHRRAYSTFWRWSNGALDCAMLKGRLWTAFGWTLHVRTRTNARLSRSCTL